MYDLLLMIAGGFVAIGGVSVLGLLAIIAYESRQQQQGESGSGSGKAAPAQG